MIWTAIKMAEYRHLPVPEKINKISKIQRGALYHAFEVCLGLADWIGGFAGPGLRGFDPGF
jgi:hypothetical protein